MVEGFGSERDPYLFDESIILEQKVSLKNIDAYLKFSHRDFEHILIRECRNITFSGCKVKRALKILNSTELNFLSCEIKGFISNSVNNMVIKDCQIDKFINLGSLNIMLEADDRKAVLNDTRYRLRRSIQPDETLEVTCHNCDERIDFSQAHPFNLGLGRRRSVHFLCRRCRYKKARKFLIFPYGFFLMAVVLWAKFIDLWGFIGWLVFLLSSIAAAVTLTLIIFYLLPKKATRKKLVKNSANQVINT